MSKRYRKLDVLGEGQFATVYRAEDTERDNAIVAVKKIKIGQRREARDGINRTALREIKLLQELHHPHILGLLDVLGHKSNISLIFDFMDTDLEMIIKDKSLLLPPGVVKAYSLMILQGLEYLHAHWILHRDLKPNNLLINKEGVLKIADFGLAKAYGSPNRIMTHQVVTRWYRSPELLFGARLYSTGVDLWAVGCIIAEMLLRLPFLPGETDLGQLSTIFEFFGSPNEENWPSVKSLPDYVEFKPSPPQSFRDVFSAAGDDLIHLLESCMKLDPSKRCTASQALQSSYFSNPPGPTPGPRLPMPRSRKEIESDIEHEILASRKRALDDSQEGQKVAKRLNF